MIFLSPRGDRAHVEFQHPLHREEYIRTADRIPAATGHPHYSSITLFFSLILLFAGFQGASAEAPVQPGTNSTTTDSSVVSAETNTRENPSSAGSEQQEGKIGPVQPQPEEQTILRGIFGPQIDPCATIKVAGETWLDQTHDFVDREICQPAVYFDSFFGWDHVLEDVRPGTFVKWRTSARWTEGNSVRYVGSLYFRYELPNVHRLLKRARLVLESRSQEDKFKIQPGQPVDPGFDPDTGNRAGSVAVQTDLFTYLYSLARFDMGVKLHWPLDPFARFRYQYTKPFGEVYLVRFQQIALFRYIEHFSETTQIDLERKFTKFTFIRWGNYVTYTEGTAGVTWNTGVSLITQLTPKSAISYDTSMWGVSHPGWHTQNYRIGILYRKNFYRRWLFFELAPEVTWPQDASQAGYASKKNSVYALMATLEVQFGK